MSLSRKLKRMKRHLATEEPRTHLSPEPARELPFDREWAAFRTKVCTFEDQFCLVREVSYPLGERWGRYRFGDVQAVVEKWNGYPYSHPLSAKGLDSGEFIFFDTETTGLGTGAGNTIFLLGVGRVLSDSVVVKQYFLPHPGCEVALYHHFLSDVREMRNLVTYNGKSFDWPQVKTRHTFVRDQVPRLPAFGHYDLLHAARRLWKRELPSLRLSVVEQHILGISRGNDTPGQMAPLLYFDYLKSQDPKDIMPVFFHNERDLLSLISLYIHLSKMLLGGNEQRMNAGEHYEIGRWYEAVGEYERALSSYRQAAADTSAVGYSAKKAAARLYKKQRQWDKAVALWKACCQDGKRMDPEPYIELSKVYEHRYKDADEALYYALKGYECWKRARRVLRATDSREHEQFQKRIHRLEMRCSQC